MERVEYICPSFALSLNLLSFRLVNLAFTDRCAIRLSDVSLMAIKKAVSVEFVWPCGSCAPPLTVSCREPNIASIYDARLKQG